MFVSDVLKTHLETSSTISLQSLVLAEWNMNMPDNIYKLGNYRYRPLGSDVQFRTLPLTFDNLDAGNYYTGATDADVVIDGGYTNLEVPQLFTSIKEKVKMLYSLEDCVKPFRPRSGINKASYFNRKYIANSGASMTLRPRYYMPSRYDEFKYWSSFRTEDNIERGVAKNISNSLNYIDDTAPFVVYKKTVPTNRLIVKMQTNVGTVDLGNFTTQSGTLADPLYGSANKTTPVRWKIQYLNENNWIDAYSFNENSIRDDGTAIIPEDGYVELEYGLQIPEEYKTKFEFAEKITSSTLLPDESLDGYAYLVIENENERGLFYIWNTANSEYETFTPEYGWILGSGILNSSTSLVTDLTSPDFFTNDANNLTTYREFSYVRGIRIVVETMNKFDSTFDLIEMSPRLVVDISNKVINFNIKKILSDIGTTSLPVGQLLASTGSLSLFDDDQAFNENNTLSIVSDYIRKNIKFLFYESIFNVDGDEYSVPIKTLYSEGFPQADVTAGTISLELRDFYFFLESMPAPRLLTTQTSLSYAISLLLDYIGFSNYTFKRVDGENDPIIPYFFIAPDQNVAEVLNQLAVSTQTAMFFDEYNNFVVMSKDYLMPTLTQRATDFVVSGSNNQTDSGVIENSTSGNLPNILSIASQDKKVYNDGKINYTTRYIQRSYGSIKQSSMINKEKTWIYKPSLLWEVAGTDSTKTINELASKQGSYVLGAMPLNSNIVAEPPTVSKNVLINNIMDLGENIYWLTRYNGYLYSNGEIIRYDAVEFSLTIALWYDKNSDGTPDYKKQYFVEPGKLAPATVIADLNTQVKSRAIVQTQADKIIGAWKTTHVQGSSNVWISSNQEYQKYFASLPFNGKIYPTGLVRIYSTPYYETVNGITRLQNGAVMNHGRGQFGTTITAHYAGINTYWTNNDNVRGIDMKTQYLFTTQLDEDVTLPDTTVGAAGVSNVIAKQSTRNSIIKNFMTTSNLTDTEINSLPSTQTGTIQSSALVFNGPGFKTPETPLNFVSYVYKSLDNAYRHFGTRMRVIGKIENTIARSQTANGSVPYYQVSGSKPDENINISGGSGGLAILLNPITNNGYYFEIVALSEDNITSYLKLNDNNEAEFSINNVIFYKVKKDSSNTDAIPVKLWGGLSKILVDDGKFSGQQRMAGEENSTVYDLSVEYEDIGKTRRFYLYINNQLIKIVDDPDPLPTYNNMALFVRGASKCMFENIYALSKNYSKDTSFTIGETLFNAFGNSKIDVSESFRKYAMSGVVQSTYLSGISSQQPPNYNMYFEEFGSIMRECAYFDIKYDRAYPALYAQLSPTFNNIKGYTTSGFYANSYGAEFLIFNSTDKALNLDETTGNFLRIQGITFTQNTTHELTVDEFFKKRGNLSDPELVGSVLTYSPLVEKSKYDEIKLSRLTYGKNEFSIDSTYIQTQDDAEAMMNWIINKVMIPKKSIGINLFSIPTLQLGDIVTVDYKDSTGLDLITSDLSRFVIYNIEYARSISGPSMTVYLSEV